MLGVPVMRLILLTAILTALAMPAAAKDSGELAFDLLAQFAIETQKPDYIKLQSSINLSDAKAIDAKISKAYGDPQLTRSGLKVWEIENTSNSGAKHTTIMCGPDGKGGTLISADRRGTTLNGVQTKSKRRKKKNKIKKSKKTKSFSLPINRSLERD